MPPQVIVETIVSNETQISLRAGLKRPPSIYFGGCAFGAAFYIGVVRAMVEEWGENFQERMIIGGGSAGTIFAIGLVLGKSVDYLDNLYREVAEETHALGPVKNASIAMEKGLRKMLDSEPDAYKRLNGRCLIGTTLFFSRFRWHSYWTSNEDVVDTVQASYHIPFYCQRIKQRGGYPVVDGAYGFGGWDLPHGDDTLYIGIDPFAEITRELTNGQMFWPSVGKDYDDMVTTGYEAFKAWDGTMSSKVARRIPNYQALYVLWFLKIFELVLNEILGVIECVLSLCMSQEVKLMR